MKRFICLILTFLLFFGFSTISLADEYSHTGDNWTYKVVDQKEITIENGPHAAHGVVKVPENIMGLPVTKIGKNAIACSEGAYVILPETIEFIDSEAISGINYSLYLPSGFITVAEDAAENLDTVTVYCQAGSPAAVYAEQNGFSVITDKAAIREASSVAKDKDYWEYAIGNRWYATHYDDRAIKILKPIANADNPHACYVLAECYDRGIEVDRDPWTAYKYYRIAAEAGIPRAQLSVGRSLIQGAGVKKDSAEGFQWILSAAEQGVPDAYLWLGYCYHKGIGTGVDLEKAKDLYLRADHAGVRYAKTRLAQLEK